MARKLSKFTERDNNLFGMKIQIKKSKQNNLGVDLMKEQPA